MGAGGGNPAVLEETETSVGGFLSWLRWRETHLLRLRFEVAHRRAANAALKAEGGRRLLIGGVPEKVEVKVELRWSCGEQSDLSETY